MVELLLGFYSIVVFALDFIEMECVLALHYFGLKKNGRMFLYTGLVHSNMDCREIKSVNSKGNQPEYSSERLILKLQYFSHLM